MKIEFPECHKAYKIPDEKIPFGKKFSVSCLACKKKIVIDLRSEEKPNEPIQPPEPEKEKKAVEPAPEQSFGKKQPSGIKLKYGILRTMDDLPAMPHVVKKAQEIMSKPDSTIKELAKVIELRQAIATQL